MPFSYSSEQFYHDWRYAISKSFVTPLGEPFAYAPTGKQSWGDELKCFKFDSPPNTAAVSSNGRYLAIAVERDVHVCDLSTGENRVLKGHVSRVDVVAFRPNAEVLVSCAMNYMSGSAPAEPTIIFWDLNADARETQLSSEEVASVSKHAVRAVVERLSDWDVSLHLGVSEQDALTDAFGPVIEMALTKRNVEGNAKVYGRLQESFQSNVFSPSGRYMIYFPGERPASNGDVEWDVGVWDVDEMKEVVTLVGHRDAIMWTGYSPDERLIGTVSWDKSMKIWDAGTGEVKFTFETSGQNWTGGFSPDGGMFAGTCGDGSIHVYSLLDGTEIFWSQFGRRWCRALDWSPDSAFLAVGGQDCGKLILIDVKKQAVVQERLLSTSRSKVEKEEMRSALGGFLEVHTVKFVDGGRKIAHFTTGDGSAEVFDLEEFCKWKFERAGTDSYLEEDVDSREIEKEGEAVSKGGFEMIVWEDSVRGVILFATVDGDAVRLWSVPLTM